MGVQAEGVGEIEISVLTRYLTRDDWTSRVGEGGLEGWAERMSLEAVQDKRKGQCQPKVREECG